MKKMGESLKKKRLLLHHLDYTNKTQKSGKLELPSVQCNADVLPDYIALFSQVGDYQHTAKTAVAFSSLTTCLMDSSGSIMQSITIIVVI